MIQLELPNMGAGDLLEKTIEAAVCRYAKSKGWKERKFVTPGHRSAPDRIFWRKGRVFWIEFKAKGKKPTPAQQREIAGMQADGLTVYVCDDVVRGKEIVDVESW